MAYSEIVVLLAICIVSIFGVLVLIWGINYSVKRIMLSLEECLKEIDDLLALFNTSDN